MIPAQEAQSMTIEELEIDGYERVAHAYDPECRLNAYIAVHSTVLGPACGGTRMLPYATEELALEDALRLAQAMTYKSAVAKTGLGGGKAVIIGKPEMKTEALLRAMGRFIDAFDGTYIAAEDMNMTVADLETMREETRWVSGVSQELGSSGNPAPFTSHGCLLGMKVCAEEVFGTDSLQGRGIVLQGIGSVGSCLAEECIHDGARLTVCDIDLDKAKRFAEEHGCSVIAPQDFLSAETDILSPCARGGLFDAESIPKLRCKVIAGAANNQLHTQEDAALLKDRGILYAPDYVLNAGGIINIGCEFFPGGYVESVARMRLNRIPDALRTIFEMAKTEGISTEAAARRIAEDRLAAGKA